MLSAYDYDISFKPTQNHAMPTATSAQSGNSIENRKFTCYLYIAQDCYSPRHHIEQLRYTKNGWPDRVPHYLKPFWIRRTGLTLEGDCVLWRM